MKNLIFIAAFLIGWGPGLQALASPEVLVSGSGTDTDDNTEVKDSPAVLEGLRNLGSSVRVPGDTGHPGDFTGDTFGDGIGLLAMGDHAAPPSNEVTFVPNEDGGGTRTIRNGKGQVIIEQTVDGDGHVTGQKEFYPDSGTEKTVEENRGSAHVVHYYDPPKEGQTGKGVERVMVATDSLGTTKVTRYDAAGGITDRETTTSDGVKQVMRFDPATKNPRETTSTHANGNVKGVTIYQTDGSGSGTLYGDDGKTVTGRVDIAKEGVKTTSYLNSDGGVQETVTENKQGEIIKREVANPDGSRTVEENPGKGQPLNTYTIPATR